MEKYFTFMLLLYLNHVSGSLRSVNCRKTMFEDCKCLLRGEESYEFSFQIFRRYFTKFVHDWNKKFSSLYRFTQWEGGQYRGSVKHISRSTEKP